VFRADKSDFLDLDPHVVERNNLLIVKLADSLKKYSDYHITVEGHANNIGKMVGYSQARIDEEEKQQVLPLSAGRAEKLKAMLIDQGIDPSLISVIGYGSSKPVVSFTDVVNRWKNRRVEFTLTKKNSR
jgi:OOP family OmpA-OmpF porin